MFLPLWRIKPGSRGHPPCAQNEPPQRPVPASFGQTRNGDFAGPFAGGGYGTPTVQPSRSRDAPNPTWGGGGSRSYFWHLQDRALLLRRSKLLGWEAHINVGVLAGGAQVIDPPTPIVSSSQRLRSRGAPNLGSPCATRAVEVGPLVPGTPFPKASSSRKPPLFCTKPSCHASGITPELSRAAKRRRLE